MGHDEGRDRVVVSNPLRTRAIADAKTKTDTIDARTLAELLAADYLPTVWQPDPWTGALRRRVAAAGPGSRPSSCRPTSASLARTVVDDGRVRRLLTIPGVGLQSAAALVAVIGDVGRYTTRMPPRVYTSSVVRTRSVGQATRQRR